MGSKTANMDEVSRLVLLLNTNKLDDNEEDLIADDLDFYENDALLSYLKNWVG